MIQFIAPAVYFLVKAAAKNATEQAVKSATSDGIEEATFEVNKRLHIEIRSMIFTVIANISILLLSIFLIPKLADRSTAIYLISSVYLGSIIYGLYRGLRNIPFIYKFISKYKINIKKYIQDEIENEAFIKARIEIANKNIIARSFNRLWGKSAHEFAREIAQTSINRMFNALLYKLLYLVIIFLLYAVLFRLVVTPFLLEKTIHLNSFQASLYPIIYAIDYFFHTNLISYLI